MELNVTYGPKLWCAIRVPCTFLSPSLFAGMVEFNVKDGPKLRCAIRVPSTLMSPLQ